MAPSDDREQSAGQPPSPFPDGDAVAGLRLALDRLPSHQRAAIRLALVERLTVPEIADKLERAPADVQAAMRDGLLALRAVLDVIDRTVAAESDAVNA